MQDYNISRVEYLTVLYKTLKKNEVTFPSEFGSTKDISYSDTKGHWGFSYIEAIFSLIDDVTLQRIFGEQKQFYPDQPITRGEAAEITAKFLTFLPDAKSVEFTDVDSDSHLKQLVARNIFSGYEA